MAGANLNGANLQGANLYGANLTGAHYGSATVFPDDFDPTKHGLSDTDARFAKVKAAMPPEASSGGEAESPGSQDAPDTTSE